MATATRKAPAKKSAAKKEQGTLDYLELALENLNQAREHAQKDARAQIDSAMDRVRETIKDVTAELRRRTHTEG
ncbi:MAG TPA: hypothetical protein VHJ39_04135 [Solirubrobacteraceae bacterium]|jgi:hypothetical protein|nr:hypothetical protein [Solirubrobacteraceae bacterium]